MNNRMFKKGFAGAIIIAILALAIIGVIVYKVSQAKDKTETFSPIDTSLDEAPEAVAPEKIDLKVVEFSGIEGKSVLDILKDKAKVEYTDSASGAFITSINGIKNTDSEFWMYSVNGTDATVAADKYLTKNGDKVKWEYKGF